MTMTGASTGLTVQGGNIGTWKITGANLNSNYFALLDPTYRIPYAFQLTPTQMIMTNLNYPQCSITWNNVNPVVQNALGYTNCAPEHSTCNLPADDGYFIQFYTANGYFERFFAGTSVGCNDSVFGDPDFGVVKTCFYKKSPRVQCAVENGTCTVPQPGAYRIYFGNGLQWFHTTFWSGPNNGSSGGIPCSNTQFATDPNPGVVKRCFYELLR